MLQRAITMRLLDQYMMEAAIIANPHKEADDQKEFIESLMKQRRFYRGEDEIPAETDFAGIQALKEMMKKDSRLIKTK